MSKLLLNIAALTALYNPANAANLTQEETDNIHTLTKDEIDALAAAYPNTAQNNNYLLLFDKRLPADKQIYQLSSWQNLKDLVSYGQLHFSPYGFRGAGTTVAAQAATPAAKTTVDLSEEDVAGAEGLKKVGEGGNSETVPAKDVSEGLNAGIGNSQPANDEGVHGDILAPVININGGASNDGIGDSDTLTTDEQGKTLADLETELAQLQKDGAHHMKIKAVEKRIAELKTPQ